MTTTTAVAEDLALMRAEVLQRYSVVRAETERLCQPLEKEDFSVQLTTDTMPLNWYLLFPTWMLESAILVPHANHYRSFQPRLNALFKTFQAKTNSGFYAPATALSLSRPTVEEIYRYRHYVDEAMCALLEHVSDSHLSTFIGRVRLLLQYEQRYQEQILADIKYHFAHNPLQPIYHDYLPELPNTVMPTLHWFDYFGELDEIGFEGAGFAFDNERPRHQVYIHPFRIASRLISNGEYLQFIADDGYKRHDLWLAKGWQWCQEQNWQAPLYWQLHNNEWWQMTLSGPQPLADDEPVCHISYYEADAYARWAGKRLPSEQEWEVTAEALPVQGNLRDSGFLQTIVATEQRGPQQLYGDVWEWTHSMYSPYPNYQPYWEGLESYENFPIQQMVLRGGSCFSAADHIRASYRYAYAPQSRLAVTGFRLAESW